MNGHLECSTGDAAAYVLGALEPHEVEPFRHHLASCAICRDEVAALQVVADMLPSAVSPSEVPRGLRKRVLATVYDEAELLESANGTRRRPTVRLKSSRRPSRIRYPLLSLIVIALCAAISGANTSEEFALFARTHRAWLAELAELPEDPNVKLRRTVIDEVIVKGNSEQ